MRWRAWIFNWGEPTAPEIQPHHPAIGAALKSYGRSAPAAAQRLDRALRVLLRGSSAADAWQFSRLTGDGFPFELTFSTADAHLRYTADPACPALAVPQRLPHALTLLTELGQPSIAAQVLAYMEGMQASSSLDYGAWIGGRHSVDPACEDRYKLYTEVPLADVQVHAAFLRTWLDLPARLLERPLHWRMLAVEPATGRLEFYFRYRSLAPGTLPLLLQPAGLSARTDELLDLIQQVYAHPLTERIPGGSVGFSYALLPGQPEVTFTLYLFARLLWGGDARIRLRFAERLQAAGLDPTTYLQLSAPLAGRDVYQTYHGLLGFVVSAQSPLRLSLGLRPPPCVNE